MKKKKKHVIYKVSVKRQNEIARALEQFVSTLEQVIGYTRSLERRVRNLSDGLEMSMTLIEKILLTCKIDDDEASKYGWTNKIAKLDRIDRFYGGHPSSLLIYVDGDESVREKMRQALAELRAAKGETKN